MLSPEEIEKLLRSLHEAVSEEDKQRILNLLAAHEDDLMQHLEKTFRAEERGPADNPERKEATYQQLLQQTGQTGTADEAPLVDHATRRIGWRRWMSVAAAVVLIIGGLLFLRSYHQNPSTDPVAQTKAGKDAPRVQMDTLFNRGTALANKAFPDGSEVALEPGSYVAYQRDFAHDKKVFLNGSATFTVKRDAAHPFAVVVGELKVTDLGTVFAIHDRPDYVKVRLLKGKVQLHSLKDHPAFMHSDIVMKPGELFRMDKLNESFAVTSPGNAAPPIKVHPAKPASFNLNFQNASLADVFQTLEGRYGRKIIYQSKDIEGKIFTGDLTNQANIENAVKLICISNNLHFEVKQDVIIIN